MATGLIALLDDVAAIAKMAAASLDDTALAAARAGAKAAGVVIDDTAVTPRYVTGFSPARELPIVAKIARGSLRNKLLYLLPAALVLSAFAPWAITPLLMAGGVYLCFEGAEKLVEAIAPHASHGPDTAPATKDAAAFEKATVASAVRTDLILSGEIMAITLATITDLSLVPRAIVLAAVGIAITVAVYGVVALIVKADDAGVILARSTHAPFRLLGRGLVTGMPPFLRLLAAIGTAAMLWVGGGILLHGLETYGITVPADTIHHLADATRDYGGAITQWAVGAACAGVVGIAIGGVILMIKRLIQKVGRPGALPPDHT